MKLLGELSSYVFTSVDARVPESKRGFNGVVEAI